MKILLTGFSGQLGRAIITSKPKEIEIFFKNKSQLNLCSKDSCFNIIKEYRPDWIINCAAYTNVEKAEEDRELAYKINALAPKYFSEAIKNYDCNLLHISTDYVFDGKKGKPYLPNDKKNPLSYYGYSKSKGEDFIADKLFDKNKANIIRTSWLMSPYGNNFALKIIQKLLDNTKLEIIRDQYGSPTTSKTLAKACWQTVLLKSKGLKLPNVMHFTNEGEASWYEIAVEISESMEKMKLLNIRNKISSILSSEYPTKAKRPSYSVLNSSNTFEDLSLKPIFWKNAIKDLLIEFKKNQI